MDDFFIHLKQEPRRYPSAMPISTIGMNHAKNSAIDTQFRSINFSFILKGNGFYRFLDRDWVVRAPCIITQHPSYHVCYGPEPTWSELFFIYEADHAQKFENMGIYSVECPVWYLPDTSLLELAYRKCVEYMKLDITLRKPDVLDREIESILVQSLHQKMQARGWPLAQQVKTYETEVLANVALDHDIETYCRLQKIAPQNFRRAWSRSHAEPPHQFLIRQRIFKSCRLLVESTQTIASIAKEIGFDDPLYFSRQFNKIMGCSPRQYRIDNQKFMLHLKHEEEKNITLD